MHHEPAPSSVKFPESNTPRENEEEGYSFTIPWTWIAAIVITSGILFFLGRLT